MQFTDKLHQFGTFIITFTIMNEAHRQLEKACQESMPWASQSTRLFSII
jgi:hypothetical protein